jgi:hypothetical protein
VTVHDDVLGSDAPPSGRRRGRVVLGVVVLAALGLLVLRHARPPSATPQVEGLSVRVGSRVPGPGPVLVASYAVSWSARSPGWLLVDVDGPGAGSGPPVLPQPVLSGGEQSVRVPVDCSAPGVLSGSPGPYTLLLRPVDGRATRRVAAPPGTDLAAAARKACWDGQAEHLRVVGVVPDGHDGPTLRLKVTVADIGPTPVALRRVGGTETAALEPGGQHVFAVPLAVTCPLQDGVSTLSWEVGPAGAPPVTTVETSLDAVQVAIVQQAGRPVCGTPPPLRVIVLRVIPGGRGRFRLLLAIRARPGRAVLGQDPATLAAGVPPVLGTVPVELPQGRATALLTWTVSCRGPHRAAPVLPVRLDTGGTRWALDVPLRDPLLSEAAASACRTA